MVKILKHGELKPERAYYSCDTCDSELAFERADVQSDLRDGSYVVCPVCKSWITTKLLRWSRS